MFKRILILIGILLVGGIAWANIPFYNANQVTLTWDAVTQDIDGDLITVDSYRLFLADAVTDSNKITPIMVWEGGGTQATITLDKGRYFVGIRSVADDMVSDINWADEPEFQEGYELFGVRFAVPPKTPPGLRKE